MAQFGTASGDEGEPQRPVALIAIRFRALVRGIAFEDKGGCRQGLQYRRSPPRLGPGNAAAEAKGEIQAQRDLCHLGAAGKSMEDTTDARPLLFLENF